MDVGDVLHSEEQLRNTLHSDDKEKLRRKLAQLQREYLKTAQRLQRAERLEAVRRHVRSRISQQKQHEQREREVTSDSSSLRTNSSAIKDPRPTEDCDTSRRNQVIRFTLPSDAACPQTPDPSHDAGRSYKPSPALRLRSRRSRLRLERRSSAETGGTSDCCQQEQTEGTESVRTGKEETVESKGVDAVNESEELFSGPESESPSLLLTHWNTQGVDDTGNKLGDENQRDQLEKDTETEAEGKDEKPASTTEMTEQKTGEDRAGSEEVGEQRGCDEDRTENIEQNTAEIRKRENHPGNFKEIKEEKKGIKREGEAESVLDSCTLVEGLLFPAEYYVRTTRRMTSSQSPPDVQAVILSQLRRGRGRGRGTNRGAHTQTSFSSLTTAPAFVDHNSSRVRAAERCQSSSVTASQMDSEACSSPTVTATRPPRGRRRRRGRGRPRTPQNPQQGRQQTTGDPRPPKTFVSSSQSVHEADRACLEPEDFDPETSVKQLLAGHASSSQPLPEGNRTPTSCAAEHQEKVCRPSSRPTQNKGLLNWTSLLLPSSPGAQTSLFPPSPRFPVSLVSSLRSLDVHLDFHLPDDQFASLKLHKLRQVAVESGLELYSTPSRNTRSSIRGSQCSIGDASALHLLPLSFTPTITESPRPDDQTLSLPGESIGKKSAEERHIKKSTETCVEQRLHATAKEDVSGLQEFTGVCGHAEHEAVMSDGPVNVSKPHQACVEKTQNEVEAPEQSEELIDEQPAAEKPSDCHDVISSLEDQKPTKDHAEGRVVIEAVSCLETETSDEPSNVCSPLQACDVTKITQNADCEEPRRTHHSQIILKSPPASVSCPFISPLLPSPTPASSPALPSLGTTPHPALTSSFISAPLSPSTQALSLCPSITSIPPSLPRVSPSRQIQDSSKPQAEGDQSHRVEPQNTQLHVSDQEVLTTEQTEERVWRRAYTLKAAAGGSLVDACCFPGSSGGLYVAAAGKWAVCLWNWTAASDWSLKHTWSFSLSVINVFPVPDAAELVCVTLGQLEIREVRLLSCSSLTQILICEGVMQTVVGVSESRVVTSSHSASGSTLQVFTLADSCSSSSRQPLVSPGVCVGALAPVDGLSDALIGTDEGGHLFIWNLKSGQLLARVLLGPGLSHTACLRGYSYCGVLFVLLQHQFLSSLNEEEKETKMKDPIFCEETKTVLFSLVGINPLSGKSLLASRLFPPKTWSGRLCEADVHRASVVGLSQSGCVCTWQLGKRGRPSRTVEAPEGEDWQLARWGAGGGDTLVVGHHNGDVSLYRCSPNLHVC